MINQIVEKSFDNIMYQQEKMDNKSYVLLGFLGFFLTFDYFETLYIELDKLTVNLISLIAIMLIVSLIPITNSFSIKILKHISFNFFKKKDFKSINIFYYVDIYSLNKNQFLKILKTEYKLNQKNDITKADEYLIEQIIINSQILRIKVFFHEVSQVFMLIIVLKFFLNLLKTESYQAWI